MQSRLIRFTLFLFVFTSINREFNPLHFDLRFILFPLTVSAILRSLTKKNFHSFVSLQIIPPRYPDVWMFAYLTVALSSNIAWLWNGLPLVKSSFYNLIVVFTLNLLTVLMVLLNRSSISLEFIRKCVIFSAAFLAVSQVIVYLGFPLGFFLSDDTVRVLQSGGEHFNFFGQHFRVSGFAEDPNYACFFATLGMIALFSNNFRISFLKLMVSCLLVFAIFLSWSRTIVFGSAAILIVLFVSKLLSIRFCFVGKCICFGLVTVSLIAPFISAVFNLDFLQTILTRFDLWERATQLFLNSPLIGNGLTSFRSFNMVEVTGWYVHCHSTVWSTLAESGLLGFLCYFGALFSIFDRTSKPFVFLSSTIFCLFCINFDATYLQASVLLLAIMPAAEYSGETSLMSFESSEMA